MDISLLFIQFGVAKRRRMYVVGGRVELDKFELWALQIMDNASGKQ